MGTTITISILTYALFRSVEALVGLMWKWYRDLKYEERKLELEEERRNRQ